MGGYQLMASADIFGADIWMVSISQGRFERMKRSVTASTCRTRITISYLLPSHLSWSANDVKGNLEPSGGLTACYANGLP
jgi:hypothetical protein